ncbi:MAG: hypothetical protein H0X24_00575 [Ktedonobacterales bacterium]|nr:hypothetical protein [Ktedonobacterales bacterium]
MTSVRVLIAASMFEVALFWAYGLGVPLPALVLVVILGHPLTIPLIAHVPLWTSVITFGMLMGGERHVPFTNSLVAHPIGCFSSWGRVSLRD